MKKERKINIKKMFEYVVKKWRWIIMIALFFAIIMTALQYGKDYQNAVNSQASQKQVSLIDIKNSFSENELREIEYTRKSATMIESADDYFANSIFMQIPYDEVKKVTLQYGITSANGTTEEKEYVSAYNNYAASGALGDDVAKKLDDGTLPQYLTEIMSIPHYYSTYDYENGSNFEISDSSFVISFVHHDEEELSFIIEKVKEALKEYSVKLSREMGAHSFVLQAENQGVVTDWNILGKQSGYVGEYSNVSGDYLSWLANLSSNQLAVYNNWDDIETNNVDNQMEETIDSEEIQKTIQISINKRSAVLGALIGAFMAVILLMIWFMGTQKVRGEEDFESIDVCILGKVKCNSEKKKLFGFVDQWIVKIINCNKKHYTDEQLIRLAYSNILIKCRKEDIHKLYCIGSVVNQKENTSWMQSLCKMLNDKGIELEIGDDIQCDADVRMRASELKNVIIVEEELVSAFNSLDEEMDTCRNNGLNVLGAILVQN